MFSSFQAAEEYIQGLDKFGSKPGLKRINLLLEDLGCPHRGMRQIVVAGTNGKGSVAVMLSLMLMACGEKTGFYSSPHFFSWQERIRIDGRMITEAEFCRILSTVVDVASNSKKFVSDPLSQFEILTAMALLFFRDAGCEVAVLEVGMGGRLDAVNAVDAEIAVITSIGYDHQEYLGHSLAEIAGEKAGIIKANCRGVILGKIPDAAIESISLKAFDEMVKIWRVGADLVARNIGSSLWETNISVEGLLQGEFKLPMGGLWQENNLATALLAVKVFYDPITPDIALLQRGLDCVEWPGRMMVLRRDPTLICDVAHNQEGVAALIHSLSQLRHSGGYAFIFGAYRDKDVPQLLEVLSTIGEAVYLIPLDEDRGMPLPDLIPIARQFFKKVHWANDITEAYANCLATYPGRIVIACGSFRVAAAAMSLGGELAGA
jgi:dihydrofolate synthase/folylpolyglutamate synthase